jgi:hypothetical protein
MLDAEDIRKLDPNYKLRADELIKDARKRSKRKKPGVALKGWWKGLDKTGFAAETTIKVAAGVGAMAATAAVGAAGVAMAAVTFGVGPAIGIVVGVAISKSVTAVTYHRHETKLRQGLDFSSGTAVLPLGLFPLATEKILMKYIRVTRRGKMIMSGSAKETARGIAYNLRHLKTTAKAVYKNHYGTKPLVLLSHATYEKDVELNERLLEFRYYGQMAFNALDEHLKTLMDRRELWTDFLDQLYGHVVRQVHFTGNHEKCFPTSCYGLPLLEFQRNKAKIQAKLDLQGKLRAQARPLVQAQGQAAIDAVDWGSNKMGLTGGKRVALPSRLGVRSTNEGVQTTKTTLGTVGDTAWDYSTNATADFTANLIKYNATTDLGWKSYVKENIQQLSTGNVSDGVSGALAQGGGTAVAVGAGMSIGIDQVVSFAKTRWERRKVANRLRTLRNGAVRLAIGDEAEEAQKEMIKELGKGDKSEMPRVATKAVWYIQKINELENDASWRSHVQKLSGGDFKASKFKDCDDAWDTARACLYLIRQYEKAMTATMYAQLQLMQLDKKIFDYGLTKGSGTLIKAGAPTPERPPHMRADKQGAHWAFTLGNDPKEDAEIKLGSRV